jgi:hypothetical protein
VNPNLNHPPVGVTFLQGDVVNTQALGGRLRAAHITGVALLPLSPAGDALLVLWSDGSVAMLSALPDPAGLDELPASPPLKQTHRRLAACSFDHRRNLLVVTGDGPVGSSSNNIGTTRPASGASSATSPSASSSPSSSSSAVVTPSVSMWRYRATDRRFDCVARRRASGGGGGGGGGGALAWRERAARALVGAPARLPAAAAVLSPCGTRVAVVDGSSRLHVFVLEAAAVPVGPAEGEGKKKGKAVDAVRELLPTTLAGGTSSGAVEHVRSSAWWDNDALMLTLTTGEVFVAALPSLRSLFSGDNETFQPGTVAVRLSQALSLLVEPPEAAAIERQRGRVPSADAEEEAAAAARALAVSSGWRAITMAERTPEQLFRSYIEGAQSCSETSSFVCVCVAAARLM